MMKNKENYNQFSKNLELSLNDYLFDQQFEVETIVKTLVQSYMIENKSKIQALFTFIGFPNSGKHFTCELLEKLNPKIEKLKTFYMEQYSGGTGVDQTLVQNFQNDVVSFVKDNPKAILIFEDIEKADLQIQLSLFTLLTDSSKNGINLQEDGDIDFSDITVVVTTTLLSSLLQRKDLLKLLKEDPLQAHTLVMEHLSKEKIPVGESTDIAFDKKLLSLLNEHTLISFNKLSLKALIKIGQDHCIICLKSLLKKVVSL